MFGYVKVTSPELKVKEYEYYRGTYCGLCRSMGKCTGQCSRMTLSYDFVFLALARIAATAQKVEFEQRRCLAHPLKKRNSMVRNQVIDYCSRAAAILNYRKVADDLKDEKGFRRMRARLALPFVSHARKKAIKKDPSLSELDAAVARELDALALIEEDKSSGVDAPADSFGRLIGEIMSFGLDGSARRITYEIGRGVGGWIYIADAIDDMSEDLKKGRYNPILKLYGGKIPDKRELELISDAVKNRLFGAEAAFDLLDDDSKIAYELLANVLFLGIPDTTRKIINSTNDNKDTGEIRSND
ncbi:MAG: hypothetical protein E7642_01770 [Ruminococcaceae bacterium]|nr:hypothetical protein [Oscillospiraceae bacterium]